MPAPAGSWNTWTSSKRFRLVRCVRVSRTSRIESGSPGRGFDQAVDDAVVEHPAFLLDADLGDDLGRLGEDRCRPEDDREHQNACRTRTSSA